MAGTYIIYLILSNVFCCGHCLWHDKSKKNERNLKNGKQLTPEVRVQVRRIIFFLFISCLYAIIYAYFSIYNKTSL